jgi:hypothetical protein
MNYTQERDGPYRHTPLGRRVMQAYGQNRKVLHDLHDALQRQYLVLPSYKTAEEIGRIVIAIRYSEGSLAAYQSINQQSAYYQFNLMKSTIKFSGVSECMLALLTCKCAENVNI